MLQYPFFIYESINLIGFFCLGLDMYLIVEYATGATSIHYTRLQNYLFMFCEGIQPASPDLVKSSCGDDFVAPETRGILKGRFFGHFLLCSLLSICLRVFVLEVVPHLIFRERSALSDDKIAALDGLGLTWCGDLFLTTLVCFIVVVPVVVWKSQLGICR